MPVGSDCPALPRTAGRPPQGTPQELELSICFTLANLSLPFWVLAREGTAAVEIPPSTVPDPQEEPLRTSENHLFLGTPTSAPHLSSGPLPLPLIHRQPPRPSRPWALTAGDSDSDGGMQAAMWVRGLWDPALQDRPSCPGEDGGLGPDQGDPYGPGP